MKSIRLLVLIALAAPVSIAVAEESSSTIPEVNTSKWKCKLCETDEGWRGSITTGLGHVSDASAKFGEYNGLNEEGSFFIGDAKLHYGNEDAQYFNLSVNDLGIDARSIEMTGGTQGSFDLYLSYNQLPHFSSDSASTPYLGGSSDTLTLPGNWVSASTTAGMTRLGSIPGVDLSTQRKIIGAGVKITTSSPWKYAFNFKRDTKNGNKRTAGSFFINSAQLIEPVDFVTDEIDASLSYASRQLQTSVSYYASTFTNNNQSLRWDNAYTSFVSGADSGELALAPDNQFQQLLLSAGYNINQKNRVSGDIAIGRMEQNQDLLAPTRNATDFAGLSTAAGNSAEAKVNTTNAKLKFTSRVSDRLKFKAAYKYDKRDNKTPQVAYDWVTTDMFLATQRTNLPYSITRNTLALDADYKLNKGTRLGAGYDRDTRKRTFMEVEKTTENTLWGNVRLRDMKSIVLEFKVAMSHRNASEYQVVSDISPAQNVLLSKYNLADRVRKSAGVHASIMPAPEYTVGLGIDFATDEYDKSVLGLTEGVDSNLNIDLAMMVSEETGINVFIGREQIKSSQAGSQTFSTADWSASNDDTFDSIGLGVTHVVIEDELDIGMDYSVSRSSGEVTVNNGTVTPEFSVLQTSLDTFKFYANYRLDESMTLKVAYWHESYDSSDWALSDVAVSTVPNLISLGETSPSYNNNVLKLAVSYQF